MYANNNGNVGIAIGNNGAVTLKNVRANDNADGGASINTCNSNPCTYTGAVTVSDSTFLSNDGVFDDPGLYISANGIISLTNVDVSSNGSVTHTIRGAWLINNVSPSVGTVTTSSSTFNNNYDDGLEILSKGNVTLNNITALSNHGQGADIVNTYGIGNVTITGGDFESNDTDGLYVQSHGSITFNGPASGNSLAYSNGMTGSGVGVYLENFTVTTPKPVAVTKLETAQNAGIGLYIATRGIITLDSINAHDNTGSGSDGVYINGNGVATNVVVNTSKGPNYFSNNDGKGLHIFNNIGSLTLNNVYAQGNAEQGVYVHSGSSSATTINNGYFSDNGYEGISITTLGVITLNGGYANSNGTAGVYHGANLVNDSSISPTPVNVSKFEFSDNTGYGLWVSSQGAITLNHVTAESNKGSFGIRLCNNNSFSSPVSVLSTLGLNEINFNYNDQLGIESYGLVTVNGVVIDGTGTSGYGIDINNVTPSMPTTILPTNVSLSNDTVSHTLFTGIRIATKGNVTFTNVKSNYTGNVIHASTGADITVTATTTLKTVTITGGNSIITLGMAWM